MKANGNRVVTRGKGTVESVCECSDCSGGQGFPQLRSDAVRTSAIGPQRATADSRRTGLSHIPHHAVQAEA